MDIGFSSASQDGSQKKLILMCGLPGAGKTTTAHRIRQALGDAIVVSRDFIRNRYKLNGHIDEYPKGEITKIDEIFYADVKNILPNFSTVILDATFKESIQRQTAFDFALKHGCQLFLIECICSDPIRLKRLNKQRILGQKKFIKPLEELMEYYKKSMQEPQKQLEGLSFLQLDTENNHVESRSIQEQAFPFVKQLVEILERPFEPAMFESYSTNYIQDNTSEKEAAEYFQPT
ncbi:ATP-binding protein [bacterium]|nr:ATP-binding protein [bacterium]MCI0690769.1 ATP-binding protein [candidate division KSB1 bacterium]